MQAQAGQPASDSADEGPSAANGELIMQDLSDDDLGGNDDDMLPALPAKKSGYAQKSTSLGGKFNLASVGTRSEVATATSQKMYKLLFADAKKAKFGDAWVQQGICFMPRSELKSSTLAFGLKQFTGGPCGVLAAIQAFIVRELLFGPDSAGKNPLASLSLSEGERPLALAHALAAILWQVGCGRRALICIPGINAPLGPDGWQVRGPLDALSTVECLSLDDLRTALSQHLPHFMAPRGSGCVLFLFSAMLTRGLDALNTDADQGVRMIAQYGYCSQELVNLLLTGRAKTNTFDGDKDVDGTVFGGISNRAPVGFLSLFEHYNYIQVGSNLKTPTAPVWVVCSESHYSVLFAHERGCLQSTGGAFDLFYYDELANQTEVVDLRHYFLFLFLSFCPLLLLIIIVLVLLLLLLFYYYYYYYFIFLFFYFSIFIIAEKLIN